MIHHALLYPSSLHELDETESLKRDRTVNNAHFL
jgi:hypothetical protein